MWPVSAKELRVQLMALTIVTWGFAAFNASTPGMYYRTGQIKGADFIHFYVLGSLAAEGRGDLLFDAQAQRAQQSRLVPVSEVYRYIPIYGPQTAIVFAGFGRLPYLWAALGWAALTTLLYGTCVWAVWRKCPALLAHRQLVALAAVGFTPFYTLIVCGQTSVLPLVCVTLGYLAFRADRKWWAGVALGSLVFKPQLGVAVAVVMAARREWRVIGGAIAAIAAQWGLSVLILGSGPLLAYFDMIRQGAHLAVLLEPRADLLHSLRAFWTLLFPQSSVAPALYLLTSAVVLTMAVRLWHASVQLETRFSGLILATVLVSPHLGGYELVLLAPALILTAGEAERSTGRPRRLLRVLLCFAYLAPLTGPLTATTHLQLSVPVMAAWLVALHWTAFRSTAGSTTAQPADA